jgi:hypothetical protein
MESLGHRGPALRGLIDDDGQEERLFIRDVPLSFYGELPLTPEVPFKPGLRMGGDEGNEERTVTDLIADLAIPGVPASKFTLVQPDLDASGSKPVADPSGGFDIL